MKRQIAVIGLGYVGLPVATALAKRGHNVLGFDISAARLRELAAGHDRTREVELADLNHPNLRCSSNPEDLKKADFFIITVPTPVDRSRRPDLSALFGASELVGGALKRGDIVVYESTVYPGATEEDCMPILERASGLVGGKDFTLGYSPERINPGDKAHRIEAIRKIVAAQDKATLDIVADIYSSIIDAGIHEAPSIRVAEAAKLIENVQRDLNIAFMNEFSAICHRLEIDTMDVIAAAGTKWNFLPFTPGLVGGHCVGVDPYYLAQCAEKAGHHTEFILMARRINEGVGARVAREFLRRLDGVRRTGRITILGLTFKEMVPDIRNSKVVDVIYALQNAGWDVQVHDPLADPADAIREYQIHMLPLDRLREADGVMLAVPHEIFVQRGWALIGPLLKDGKGVVVDIKSRLDRGTKPPDIELWRL